jgi:hypothetical protein
MASLHAEHAGDLAASVGATDTRGLVAVFKEIRVVSHQTLGDVDLLERVSDRPLQQHGN